MELLVLFQFTPPRRGRLEEDMREIAMGYISIHAPA